MSNAHGAGPEDLGVSVPHSARMWNYWLGGKDNYAADRVAADAFAQAFPAIVDNARAFRTFLRRGITFLCCEAGVEQFLDIGTGLPTANNTHQVAQHLNPACRIVYVDNDPLVLAHARALLTSTEQGATAYVHADLHDPEEILGAAAATLDFDRPVGLILSGILGHLGDEEKPVTIVARLLAALASGSYLLICDGSNTNARLNTVQDEHNSRGQVFYQLRSPDEIAAFFSGLQLVEPGIVPVPMWRPEPTDIGAPTVVDAYGGVGRKP